MNNMEQQFLNDLDAKLWSAADKLRANLDAANYKHVVLGLIFLKYVSDAFEERQRQLRALFQFDREDNIYYLPREDFDSDAEYQQALEEELEVLDYYREANVFWVPKPARWRTLKEKAVLPVGSVLWQDEQGNDIKLRSVSWLIDNALEEIEKSNAKLKGILNRISQYQLDNDKLLGLINTFSDTSFTRPVQDGEELNLHSKDILGHVYEYFLGQFALAEGKQGGQYYTPKSIVTLITEMLEPYSGRVFDPAMGSGGFFVSSDRFIEEHAKEQHYDPAEQRKHISVYGQESNPTTWRLAAMNMAIRGIDFNFGKKNADSFLDDQHPDLRADFVMANPPFNMKDWWSESLADDARWQYGTPPKGNANFAWLQHMLHHLAPAGSMALLLANGSMSSNTGGEGEIRKRLIEEDLVECMVALPGQLFTNTQIPACIWFLTKNKAGTIPPSPSGRGTGGEGAKRDRRGEVLFIDARNLGFMRDRVLRDFTVDDIAKIADTFHAWQQSAGQHASPTGRGAGGEGVEGKNSNKTPAKLLQFARELRQNQTDAEALLWHLLRNRQVADAKFRRQHPIDNYIADFYCHEHQLIIELDGSQHLTVEGEQRDAERTRHLQEKGIRVLRFDNRQVLTETEAVLDVIYNALTQTLSQRERAYQDIPGFCKSAGLDEIKKHDFVLTPGRYVGAQAQEDDGEPFAEKMARLTGQLREQFAESDRLEAEIKRNLGGLGYEL
ncbi:MAG: N-6 DNA methylase [Halothiobacillaceae bacterium]